jgi:hypothetical protein
VSGDGYEYCDGCQRECENLLDHDPACPKAYPPPEPLDRQVALLTAELEEAQDRLEFRERVIQTLFATLMGFEMSTHRVERIFDSVRSELACGFPYLRSQPLLARLAELWQAQLAGIESELVGFRKDERKAAEAAPLVDCDVCLGTAIMPGTFTTPCSRCTGTGKVAT